MLFTENFWIQLKIDLISNATNGDPGQDSLHFFQFSGGEGRIVCRFKIWLYFFSYDNNILRRELYKYLQ